jgi:protein-tyrosine phosphatase
VKVTYSQAGYTGGSNVVDIHSHILPGVDDGARTLEESVAMLKLAAEHGTTDIVATPHANSEFRYDLQLIEARFADLSEAARGIIRVHLGCDFHVSFENVQDALEHPTRYAINRMNYVMVELPDSVMPAMVPDVLKRLRSAGMIPVITHPERNSVLRGRIDTLSQWVEDGCLLQITAQSLLGRFGRETEKSSDALFRRGLVHFVASDAHDCVDRPPRLDEAYRKVSSSYGSQTADALFKINPTVVLTGGPLPKPGRTGKHSRFRFWR